MKAVAFTIKLTQNCVDMALNSLNSVQATVAFVGKCTRGVFVFELEDVLRLAEYRKIFNIWWEIWCTLEKNTVRHLMSCN